MMKSSKPKSAVSVATMSDDDLLCHLRSMNVYDSLTFDPNSAGYSVRLFGNSNIGALNATNLQVPGQIAVGAAFVVMSWYVRTNLSDDLIRSAEFAHFANHTYATMVVGEMPRWLSSIAELFRNRAEPCSARYRAPLWPEVIPTRQNFSVNLEMFGNAADQMRDLGIRNRSVPHLWVHLEGVTIPREIYLYDHESELDEAVAKRWLALQAKVLRLLTSHRSQQVDTAEHIARYLWSMGDDAKEDEVRAQLTALADAVREGRWRESESRSGYLAEKLGMQPRADEEAP